MRKLLDIPETLAVVLLSGCTGAGSFVSAPSANTPTSTTAGPPPNANYNAVIFPGFSLPVGTTTGRFTVVANLATPRAGHTATLLPNGSILVAGAGRLDIDDLLLSFPFAEIVSPSGQVSLTASLTTAREFHTGTLLQNGKVLITGGNVFYSYPTWLQATASAELYDPATGQFAPTGDMLVARTGHSASLLLDRRVLIFGGTTAGTPSAEIYDPAKGTFAPLPSPLFSRTGHTATVLPSGKVLFIGGRDNSGTLASAETYDPTTNNFKAVGKMAEQRTHHTATLLPNGKVLVTGGGVGPPVGFGVELNIAPQQTVDSPSQTAELFDPQTETFTSAGMMNAARSSHTATLLRDGTVLLVGGSHSWSTAGGYTSDNTAEIYDPATGSFKSAGNPNTGKFWHTATPLPDGTVVFAGGIADDRELSVVETFK